jgi:hypothetical protein
LKNKKAKEIMPKSIKNSKKNKQDFDRSSKKKIPSINEQPLST